VPKTCGTCHGNNGMAGKHGLASVYPNYIDSIHGFALSKEGLLVAANCQSCHGSHNILSHTNPAEPDLQIQHPQDLRQLPRQDQCRLPAGRSRQGHRRRQNERAGLQRLPHRARHSAAH
jgi:cytochrome c553